MITVYKTRASLLSLVRPGQAAVSLYLDIINLFLYLLQLISITENR